MVIISSSTVMITIAGTDEAFVLVRRILLVAFARFRFGGTIVIGG